MKNHYTVLLFLAIIFGFAESAFSEKVFLEANGVVMMEAESTESSLGLWTKRNLIGSSGAGHLEFTGNTPEGTGVQRSPIQYKFKITSEGDYALYLRGRRSDLLDNDRKDIGNDAYVRVEGDFTLGAGGPPNVSYLKEDHKMFIGRGGYQDATGTYDWRWGDKLDIEGLSTQPKPIYHFKAGETYTLVVSGRSTYFCMDRILLVNTTANLGSAQASTLESATFDDGAVVKRYSYEAINHFEVLDAGEVDYYKDGTRQALAIDASVIAERDKYARATTTFTGDSDTYDVTLATLAEFDGECTYRFLVNGMVKGTFQNPKVAKADDYQLQTIVFKAITINTDDVIAVESNTHTNGNIPEGSGTAWARGRWKSVSMAPAVYQGRVAVVADGNYRDSDDIAGTPISLAILRAMGLEDKLVHYSHSCDLVPGSNDPGGAFREAEMQLSCDGTASRWGGFDHITFYNCMSQKAQAVADLIVHINASSKSDPLWLIEAGEPDVIWEAVNGCEVAKREFIHIVSHHIANDKGDNHDLSDVMALGIPSSNLSYIPDQNTLLKKPLADWYWARDHADDRIKWLWERGFTAQTSAMNYPAIVGSFDCSDAGMIYYWGTLDSGGDIEADVPKLKKLFLDYLESAPSKVTFVTPKADDVVLPGTDLEVTAELTVNADEIDSVALFINDVLVRTIEAAPFFWGATDELLKNMQPGVYNLKLVATDTASVTSEAFLKTEVPDYVYFVSPKAGAVIETGESIVVEAALNVDASNITSLELFINDTSVSTIAESPYVWGSDFSVLSNLEEGNYELKLVATTIGNETSTTTLSFTVESIPVQEPYTGTAITIPGKIEMENYDLGGEGLAYHDTDDTNKSGEYRTDGVDIGTGTSGSYVIGNALVGEWTEYTVNVENDGKYDVNLNYSSGKPGGGAKVKIEFKDEGITLVPDFTVPVTANWQTYDSILIGNVDLMKGEHVLRVTVVMNGLNLDWIEFKRTDVVGTQEMEADRLIVFPNPSASGIFHITDLTNWEVYSITSAKVAQGQSSIIDLSAMPKGLYVLKAGNAVTKLLSK